MGTFLACKLQLSMMVLTSYELRLSNASDGKDMQHRMAEGFAEGRCACSYHWLLFAINNAHGNDHKRSNWAGIAKVRRVMTSYFQWGIIQNCSSKKHSSQQITTACLYLLGFSLRRGLLDFGSRCFEPDPC